MTDPALKRQAAAAGIEAVFHDGLGQERRVSEDTLRRILTVLGEEATPAFAEDDEPIAPIHVVPVDTPVIVPVRDRRPPQSVAWRLELENGGVRTGTSGLRVRPRAEVAEVSIPGDLPLGYHRLVLIRADNPWADTTLAIVPRECYRPPALRAGARLWGPMLQLYALRSERQWGIGDFTDLADAAELWHERGAGLFGVSPLHALFPHHPEHASPYSPSSRRFLNVLFIDVEAVPEFAVCADVQRRVASAPFQRRLRRLRASPQVDYSGVAACKLPILRRLFRVFRDREWSRDTPRARRFRAFRAMHGAALRQQALFDALARQVRMSRPRAHGWLDWPAELRAPSTAAAQAFAAEHPETLHFHEYLQWIAHEQLSAAAERVRNAPVGLYLDLAVSVDRAGAEVWSNPDAFAATVSIGAPPDDFHRRGQNWGLLPYHPRRLRQAAYRPWIEALRSNMRYAGALRIDHIMGLLRQYWIPEGAAGDDGAYVHFPLADLLGLLALESHRERCLIVGEDLGTVPDAIRAAMRQQGIYGYRVLFFERDENGRFHPPDAYSPMALAAVTTHDLPTLAGYWEGVDLNPSNADTRADDRLQLGKALAAAGLDPVPAGSARWESALSVAVHRFLARSPAALMTIQAEDVFGQREAVNRPGTSEVEHPNWRLKLRVPLRAWASERAFIDLTAALAAERPQAPFAGGSAAAISAVGDRVGETMSGNTATDYSLSPADSELLDRCTAASQRLLAANLTPSGIMAASRTKAAEARRYTRVFGRDAAICVFGMNGSGVPALEEGAVSSLDALADLQAPNGQIPKYVDPMQKHADFWYLGCIDATLWWLLAVARVRSNPVIPEIATRWETPIARALDWLHAQEHPGFYLLQQNEASDWADIMPRSGFVLYTNALWYRVKQVFDLPHAAETRDYFNHLFRPDRRDLPEHRRARLLVHFARRGQRGANLYFSFVNLSQAGEEGDVFGNLLAVLCGLADDAMAERIVKTLRSVGAADPYPIRVVTDPITVDNDLWRHYMARHQQNHPDQYHNGGIWPFVGGYWVMTLARLGKRREALESLVDLARANALNDWRFTEWFHGRTLEPCGMAGQSWNAATFLAARRAVETGRFDF